MTLFSGFRYYIVCLVWLFFFLCFLTSLIKFIIWNLVKALELKFFYRQEVAEESGCVWVQEVCSEKTRSSPIWLHIEENWENLGPWSYKKLSSVQFSSVAQLCSTLWPHELQHARPPCQSTPGVYPNSCPLSRWCHPTISSSVIPFSSCSQSFPASGSFQMSQLFASGGQSIGVSASTSVLPMNSQDWSPLGWTGWISLQSKGLSRVFSNNTVQKHQWGLK